LLTNPTPSPFEPDSATLASEAQAIQAAETLLSVTKTLHQRPDLLNTPEFGQKVLLRGELIQAIVQLPFKNFSPKTQVHVIDLLKASQALDPEIEKNMQQYKDVLGEQMHEVQTAQAVQSRYHTNSKSSTREHNA
jgi:hypothetical protein